MGKFCEPPSSTQKFALVIFILLILSVGLLVFVLRGTLHHQNHLSSLTSVSHISDTAPPRSTTHSPSPHVDSKGPTTKLPDTQADSSAHTPTLPWLEETPWLDFRLPKYVLPLHYDLLLQPDLQANIFTGMVNITVNVTRETKYFVVHAYRLTIKESRVYDVRQEVEVDLDKSFAFNPHEYFVMATAKNVKPGTYKLHFSFGGMLNGTIIGFYKSTYKNGTRYLATSKFQPTYARRAFPCFDEPSFKSTFTVSLVHDEDHIALSNMPVEATEPFSDPKLYVTKFQKSVPMVTYLACFIVCDFQYKGNTTSSGKPFRVYTTPDQVHLTTYALKFGSRVLEYFEKYFGIDYPLPKQDMVAIPDFSSGAMEHWGVITFRETNLLFDPENSSPQNLQRISAVIAHEMTHMWFGNLVTMEWWDDLWLNEGFASYVEYKGVDEQHPEWDTLSQFVTEELQPVMNLDSTMSSHPIVQPVEHPDEITEIFDDISYGKGASVLRMLEFFVGKDNFRTGISNFLKKYKYKNAKTGDLWTELSKTCGYPGNHSISNIMKTWTEQMGFPYISVKVEKREQNTTFYVAKQDRFLKNEVLYRQNLENSKEYIWSVPLSYTKGDGESGIIWMHDADEMRFSVPTNQSEWVKFNVNQTGFYLVNYEKDEWDRFINLLINNHKVLTASDRSNLLFDTFMLAEAGHVNFDLFLAMSTYLKKESHLIPWETAYASFVHLCQLLEATEVNVLLKSYLRDLTNNLYKQLGWKTSKNHLDNLLRTTIIGLACHSGNEDCLSEASELFQNWTQGQHVPTSLRSLVYNFGMAEIGREEHWNYMWNRYLAEESPAQKKAIMNGLAHVRKPELILRYLDYAMDVKKVRSQDFFTILTYIAGNSVGRPLAWNFIREKWSTLVERFTLNNRYLGTAVKKICSYFTTESELQEMKAFFTKYPDAGAGKRRRQQALEAVQNNIKWIKSYAHGVKTWLEQEGTAPWYYHRLPAHIVPEHYDLLLYPVLDKDIFNGSVAITVALQKPSNVFLVHAVELNVTKAEVRSNNGTVALEEVFLHEENNYLVLKAKRKLPIGRYTLYFEFSGAMTLSLKGMYKSSYYDPELKQTRYLATTQFAAVDARRAFPCFDEPSFKATFNVSVMHNTKHFALSNTAVENITPFENNISVTQFEKSLPMVTYLLCVIVSDFDFTETVTENGVKLRVYAAPYLIEKTFYALDVASRILDYYEKYFGIPFPLKKLDLVAIPDMFYKGMENWGVITFTEESLITENSSSKAIKYEISGMIAHELAHMWFGDLVTMTWWNDLWLNEGFATYIAQKGVQHAEPDIDKENDRGSKILIDAMRSDRTIHSHPIVQPVERVTFEIYDDIEYLKGSSMLRMLESFMGEDFSEGVSAYLKKYSFSNARTEDLWDELTVSSKEGLNVSTVMDTWSKQMNYPFISIKRDENAGNHVLIQQHRFLEDSGSKIFSTKRSPYNYIWQIPLTYRTSESNEISHLLLNSSEPVNISMPEYTWTKFNVDFSGYYSVNYDKMDWGIFIKILENNHTIFSPADRINLLFDAFSLASAGHLDYDVPLSMVRYLKNEQYHGAWKLALQSLTHLKRLFFKMDREVREILNEYIRSLSRKLLKKYDWNDTGDFSERELRKVIIEAACESGNQNCLTTASNLFMQWMRGGNLSSETKKMVYVYGLKTYSGEKTWDFMWNKYLEESDPVDKLKLLDALATFKNTTLLERLMKIARNETLVRKHHYLGVLENIAQNTKGFILVTQHIFNKWPQLVRIYGLHETGVFAAKIFRRFTTEKDLERVKEFYRKNRKDKEGAKERTLAIDSISRNINWIKNHQNNVRNWLKNNVYMPWKEIRLPSHITPTRYDITLDPNISLSVFYGIVKVELNITKDTDYILLQESGLQVISTELRSMSAEENATIPIDEELSYKRFEFHVIRLFEPIPSGSYLLQMKYTGQFSEDGRGMKRYEYTHRETGETRYLIATRFEATFARKVFPCFDEPAMKSKFKLNIIHNANQTAVSNMPVELRVDMKNSLANTVFLESVTMSTYLLFFVVSDFDHLEADYKGKKVRAFAPPDRIHEAEHGLNLTLKLLEKFEEYFDVPYVLPKLDSIAIPNYTVPGMEHWGAIAYDTNRFLVNETMTDHNRIVWVDRVIAHEIVHQWFGNLVTMFWWNDLWLNEGMSTMIMYVPLKQYHPSIEEVDVRKMSRMMCHDSNPDSHPIVRNATTPDEIDEAFDIISYEKGGAVVKMLQHVLKDDFRIGLSNFLKKYAYKNAETKDLWAELSNATTMDFNITEMMDTWTRQMGFPYVDLKRDGSTLTATQHWFSRTLNETETALVAKEHRYSSFGFIWKIPLVYKNLATGNEQLLWLNEKTATFQINAMKEDVIKFNPGFVGFYIVKYDTDDWERLGKTLQHKHEDFSVTDRYNLLHDAFLLAETDRLVYDIPLELTKYLSAEKEALPWNLFRDNFLHFLRRLDEESEAVSLLKTYVRNLTADLYDEYVWAAHNRSMLRKRSVSAGSCTYTYVDLEFIPTIVDLACRSDNEKCLEGVHEDLQLWLLGQNTTTNQHFILDMAISHFGNNSLWDYISDEMLADDTDESRKKLLAEGLISFTSPALITKTLDVLTFHPKIDASLAKFMFQGLSQKPHTLQTLWNYTRNHWDVLMKKLDAKNNPSIGVSIFCHKLKTIENLGEFIRLMKSKPELSGFIVDGCIEDIQNSIEWVNKYEETLTTWLTWNVNQ